MAGFFSKIKQTAVQELSFYNRVLKDIVLKKIDDRYLNFSTSLTIYGENKSEKCVYLGENNTLPIWVIELSKEGTETYELEAFEKIAKNHTFRDESKLTIIYSKRPIRDEDGDENFYEKQSTYLYSYNKKLIEDIAFEFDIDLLAPDKIIQSFYDIGLINKYYIDKDKLSLKSLFHFNTIPKDKLNNLYFKTIFAEGVYNAIAKNEDPRERNYKLFQGLVLNGEYLSGNPDLYKLYREKWFGYIAMNINVSNKEVVDYIQGANISVQFGDKKAGIRKEYQNASDHAEEISTMAGICNIVACLDREDPIKRIGSNLNVQFIPKSTKVKNIIYATPVTYKDGGYDFVAPLSTISGWIKSIHKKHNIKSRTRKHMYGRDVSHNFINYSWSETGDSLHWAIVAPTRSGKTFGILKTIQSILEIEVEPKTDEEIRENRKLLEEKGEILIMEKIKKAKKLGDARIVHFDTGQSAFPFVTELKRAYPEQVYISQDNVGHMRFGLLNIDFDENRGVISENDLLFSVSIINLILSLNGGEDSTINGAEMSEFSKALLRVFRKDDYRGLTIAELQNIEGYEEVIDRLYAYGEKHGIEITRRTRTTDMGLRGTRLDYIQKPILSDLIKEVERKSKNYTISQHEKDASESLVTKLKIIESMPMFAYYDKQNIQESDYYYIELQQLKSLGARYFLPAYMITLRRLYRRDTENAARLRSMKKPVPDTVYILEEVHNFIKIDLLEQYFEVITREASRYHIYFGFITQSPKDIPEKILANIGSRMVLSSNRVTKSDLAYYWSTDQDDKEQAKYLANFYHTRKRKYLIFINSGQGIVTLDQKVSKSEASLFNSNGNADLAEEIEEDVA